MLREIIQKSNRLCTALCKMLLFYAKMVVRDSHNFELEEEEEENTLVVWRLSGSVLLQYLFMPLGVLLVIEDEWYVVTKAYKLTNFEIITYHYPYICTDSMICWVNSGEHRWFRSVGIEMHHLQ